MELTDADFANALEHTCDALLITDTKGVILYANEQFSQTTGYSQEEIIGKTPSILQSPNTPRNVYQDLWKTIESGKVWTGRILNTRKQSLPMRISGGDPKECDNDYWAQLTVTPLRNQDGEIYLYSAAHKDLTAQIEIEEFFDFERKGAQVRAHIASILQQSLPLYDRIMRSLNVLTALDDLHLENKCGVFIANDEQTHLNMFALHGEFSQEFIDKEKQIPFGNCLCGRVAQSGEPIVSDDCFCDDRHENIFAKTTPHGHYIIPLRIKDRSLGVLFLYTEPYPDRNQSRLDMLQDVGHLFSQAIRNDQVDQKLILATQAAKDSSQTKSDFLANMSHEIRTPLNGILGYTEMLLRKDDRTTQDEHDQWIGVIQSSGQHLLQLINNILDLSKVEAGELDLELTRFDPISMVSDLTSALQIHASDKMIDLSIETTGPLPRTITSDPTRYRQVLTNLIGNAIKFTQKGSVIIQVGLEDSDSQNVILKIDVKDTGTGIPQNKLDTIFEPFSQADSSITRDFGGTGLGLTICRKLAKAMDGSLTVSSQLGTGSTFTFTMPIGPAADLELHDNLNAHSKSQKTSCTSESTVAEPLHGHILLVDDGQTNRQLISLILERAGAQVTTAQNGKEGFDLASTTHFDLILMDMQMPVMDGYTATIHLRQCGVKTPIIALTASAMTGDRERCINAGCSEYMTKPVDIEMLIKQAAQWLQATADKPTNTDISSQSKDDAILPDIPVDDAALQSIVLDYISTIPAQIAEIEQAWKDQNLDTIAQITHRLIGSGGTVGLAPLTDAALQVEQCMQTKHIEKIAESIDQLRSVTDRILFGADQLRSADNQPNA